MTGEGAPERRNSVPIMGRVGAGAEIEPEFEQVPPEGLFEVELPFAVPDEMIGLEIAGDSMLPKYEDGDVIVVYREQRRATDAYVNAEVAVRTAKGRRFLKRLRPGAKRGTYDLESWNAKPIAGVHIEWVGEIHAIVPAGQIRRIAETEAKVTRAKRTLRSAAD